MWRTFAGDVFSAVALNVKIAALSFYGLDKDGIPTALTVTDDPVATMMFLAV